MADVHDKRGSIKDRVWARYGGMCWACGLSVNTKHGRLEPIEDEPRSEKMREDNLVVMHKNCALLKPTTPTWEEANRWRKSTRGAAGARLKTTIHLASEILDHGCDPEYVRDILRQADDEMTVWRTYCDTQEGSR